MLWAAKDEVEKKFEAEKWALVQKKMESHGAAGRYSTAFLTKQYKKLELNGGPAATDDGDPAASEDADDDDDNNGVVEDEGDQKFGKGGEETHLDMKGWMIG